MSIPIERSILPLALEPFEEYMVRDERPGYPMVIPAVLEFAGHIDRSAMEQAFREALSYEPLLTARLARRGRCLYWISSSQLPMLVWEEGSEPPDGDLSDVSVRPGHVFDLTEEPGLRAQVRVSSAHVTITCYFHHACTDGLGAFQFIANWLACYGRILGDVEGLDTDFPTPGLATRRADLDIVLPEPLTRGQITRASLIESYRWLARRPRPLAKGEHQRTTTSSAPSVMLKRLDDELVCKLRTYATHKEVRLNDLLLRDMFLTIRDWNSSYHAVKEGQHIRILMPTSLRKPMHRGMPAANLLGYGSLTRKISDCHRPDELLYGIRDEVNHIRDWSLGAVFLHGVGIFLRIPYALQVLTSARFCHATCVVSNLGPMHKTMVQERFQCDQTIRVGELELQEVFMAPPVRPNTWASLAFVGHKNTLDVAMNVDLNQVRRDHAIRFLRAYCSRLNETASGRNKSQTTSEV